MHNYSPPQSQYFVEPPFAATTAASLLGYVSISLAHLATGNFSHSSRQNCSSSLKLDGFRWCTAIFKSYHRFLIGLRSLLWLGHSKTFKCFPLNYLSVSLGVCLGSLPCLKVNLHPGLKSLEDWIRFRSRISLYLAGSIIPSILTSFPVPADETHPHSMMLPPPWWCSRGDERCWVCSRHSISLMAKNLNLV